jgi:peptide-methionine (S)-S-oxide reductase
MVKDYADKKSAKPSFALGLTTGIACFGAGCFWGVQYRFDEIPGVMKSEVGYMGGEEDKKNYTYEDVCSGKTRHAEVVFVEFDSEKISYEKLLEAFWKMHDPTQIDRQGPDVGDQYRSVIFYFDGGQKNKAEKSLMTREKEIGKKIVTQIVKARKFYRAEEYHQKYNKKTGRNVC